MERWKIWVRRIDDALLSVVDGIEPKSGGKPASRRSPPPHIWRPKYRRHLRLSSFYLLFFNSSLTNHPTNNYRLNSQDVRPKRRYVQLSISSSPLGLAPIGKVSRRPITVRLTSRCVFRLAVIWPHRAVSSHCLQYNTYHLPILCTSSTPLHVHRSHKAEMPV